MDTTLNVWFWLWIVTLALLFGLGVWVRAIREDSTVDEHEWLEGERGD